MDSFKSFSNTIATSTRDSYQQNNNSPLTGESIAFSAALEFGYKGKDNALEAKNYHF